MKPDFPIDTPAKVTQAREYLGLDKIQMGNLLRMGRNSRATVRRLEAGGNKTIPGPVQIALESFVSAKAGVAQPNWAALGLGSADEAAGRN